MNKTKRIKTIVVANINPSKLFEADNGEFKYFNDKHLSGRRLKFSFVHPTGEQVAKINLAFAYADIDAKAYIHSSNSIYSNNCLCVKVFS